MFRFHAIYFSLVLSLLFIEVIIACFLNDKIIRPYGGDFLVVILLYCMVRSVMNLKVWFTGIAVLLGAYLIEMLQFFHISKISGLEKSKIALIVMGNHFSWGDMLAYSLGILFVIFIETKLKEIQKI